MSQLNISYQNIVEFPDLTEQTETEIYIDNNYIEEIDFTKCPNGITLLDIRKNDLTELPKNAPKTLKKLYLQNNKIESVDELPENLEILDLSSNGLTQLCSLPITIRNVHLLENALDNIDFISPPLEYKFLSSLTISGNCLTDVDFRNLINLKFISLDDNNITDINGKLPARLQEIQMRNNKLKGIKNMPATLAYMDFQNNDIEYVVSLPRDFERIQLGNNPLVYNINKYMRLNIKGICQVIYPLRKYLSGLLIMSNIRKYIAKKKQ